MKHFVNDDGYGFTTVPAHGTLEIAPAYVDGGMVPDGEREYSVSIARRRSRAVHDRHPPEVAFGIRVQLTELLGQWHLVAVLELVEEFPALRSSKPLRRTKQRASHCVRGDGILDSDVGPVPLGEQLPGRRWGLAAFSPTACDSRPRSSRWRKEMTASQERESGGRQPSLARSAKHAAQPDESPPEMPENTPEFLLKTREFFLQDAGV
jgi:hypothetical protein